VPLSISLALVSQATPVMGILTAIWGGLFGAAVGGSVYNIQGPTGAMSSLLTMYSVSLGMDVLPWLAVGAGVCSFIAYYVRLDLFCNLITENVMEGFVLGVAFTIGANQLPYGLGLLNLHKHRFLTHNVIETFSHIHLAEPLQTSITCFGFIMLLVLNKWRPLFPWILVLAAGGILLGYLVDMDDDVIGGKISPAGRSTEDSFPLELMKDRYPRLNQVFFEMPKLEVATKSGPGAIISGSISLMLVAVVESLISGKIAAERTGTEFEPRSEILSIGAANLACGLAGGFPCTAALARTNLNIAKGATSRTSAIISAVGVALITKTMMPAFRYMPLAVIAAMMLKITVGMPNWAFLSDVYSRDKASLLVILAVAFTSVTVDPSAGIFFGVGIEQLREFKERRMTGQ